MINTYDLLGVLNIPVMSLMRYMSLSMEKNTKLIDPVIKLTYNPKETIKCNYYNNNINERSHCSSCPQNFLLCQDAN